MSLADAFSDAVADIDRYLTEARDDPWYSGHPSHPWYERVVACRNEMETIRCILDAVGMGRDPEFGERFARPYSPDDQAGGSDAN